MCETVSLTLKEAQLGKEFRCESVVLRTPSYGIRRLEDAWRPPEALNLNAFAREALSVAAPSLLARWHEADAAKRAALAPAISRYLVRMCSRPTPFGLFATVSPGSVGKTTHLELGELEHAVRRSRLDMKVLLTASQALTRDDDLIWDLCFLRNDSLHPASGFLRYYRVDGDEDHLRYMLEEVELTPYLQSVLARAARGASLGNLACALHEAVEGVTLQEARTFLRELVEAQLLVPAFRPQLTGSDPLGTMLRSVEHVPEDHPVVLALRSCESELQKMDGEGFGLDPRRYGAVEKRLRRAGLSVARQHLVQVDVLRPASVRLGEELVREIGKGVELLHRMFSNPEPRELVEFRERFLERYGDRSVPLCEALDEESGIGFGGRALVPELLQDIPFGERTRPTMPVDPRRHAALVSLVERAWCDATIEVDLHPNDIERLERPDALPLPDAFAAMCTVAAPDSRAIDAGRFRVLLKSVAGPSGGNLLGRFCHLSRALEDMVRGHLAAEQTLQNGAILAEVVHLPQGRVGNVLLRPVLREWEIPLLGRSGAPPDRQIQVSDLMVMVRRGRITLWSQRLEREIIPRLTTAHNYTSARNIALYRFLCLLQQQGVSGNLTWQWGVLGKTAFLPRVRHGRTVLSRARWRMEKHDIASFRSARREERAGLLCRWRERLRMPRWIWFAEGDKELLVDTEDAIALEMLADALKGRHTAEFREMFPAPGDLCVRGPDGEYTHEMIIPFVRTRPTAERSQPEGPILLQTSVQRTLMPGSEWLYAKLYCAESLADRLLTEHLAPLLHRMRLERLIDGWFFVRYADPEHHIRVRCHGTRPSLWENAQALLNRYAATWEAANLTTRLVYDTYEREIERYGGDATFGQCELFFQHDSEAAVDLIGLTGPGASSARRWKVALMACDRLLVDFGYDLPKRVAFMSGLRAGFLREVGAGRAFRKEVARKLRTECTSLHALLALRPDDAVVAKAIEVLVRRSQRVASVIRDILAAVDAGKSIVGLDDIVGSLMHMQCNRLFSTSQRRQEAVLYDLLAQLYSSLAARGRGRGAGSGPTRERARGGGRS